MRVDFDPVKEAAKQALTDLGKDCVLMSHSRVVIFDGKDDLFLVCNPFH